MHAPITLRPFQPSDQPAAKLLIQQGLGEHFGFIDQTLNPDLDDIAAHYVTPGHLFVVADLNGHLVATGALIGLAPGVAQVVRVSVQSNYRRQGIGRAIVALLLQAAYERGFRRVQVETNRTWWDAIGLYTSHGFSEYARDEVSVYLALDLPAQRETKDPATPARRAFQQTFRQSQDGTSTD